MKTVKAAKELISQGRLTDAISLLEKFVLLNPREREGAHRYLSILHVRNKNCEKAKEVLKNAIRNQPENQWLELFYGDILFFDCEEREEAITIYEKILARFPEPVKSTMSPYRYVLKRLSNYYYETGKKDLAKKHFELFYSIQPSDFYATDFLRYTQVLLDFAEIDTAKDVLAVGIKTHPHDDNLINFAKRVFPQDKFWHSGKPSVKEVRDAKIIPVRTELIREGDIIEEVIDRCTKKIRKHNDIITVSSCVASIAEERVIPVDTVKPGFFARLYSSFVSQKSVPFGGAAPLANPYAMQVAIEETGLARISLGILLGAIFKLFGKSGVFYRVAGPQSALIDDPPASIPPYDYAIIPGPKDSFLTAQKIKHKTGCEAAVVDANDLGYAWVVGYTEGVNKEWLENVLSGNPAGNEDQATPIVIVRSL